MQLSDIGVDLITNFEGLKLDPYNDSRGFATIGIGHLIRRGPVIPEDKSITKQQAYDLFKTDSAWAQKAVSTLVKVPLSQHEFDALVSWTFNLGSGTLANSMVLTLLNAQKYAEAAVHMLLYNKSGGAMLPGLVRRRQAEVNLFLSV